jgi:hypothetical protein
MAPSVLITVALVILMAKRLVDMYAGGHYICPSYGGEKAPDVTRPTVPRARLDPKLPEPDPDVDLADLV